MSGRDRPVLLGEFGRAHGLRGELRLKSYTADPLAIAAYGPLAGPDGRRIVLSAVRNAAGTEPDMLVARVEGVSTREAAERLNRVKLHVSRDRLGEPEEDEFFLADLIGLSAFDADGEPIGRIAAVPDFGGGAMIEIAPGGGPTFLVPFTREAVPTIDIRAGRVVIVRPAETEAREPDGSDPA